MTFLGKIVAVVLILAGGIGAAVLIFAFRPQAVKSKFEPVVQSVEAITLKRQDVPVTVSSQGVLEPRTETHVAAEVAGKVVVVSPGFEVGAVFAPDEVILQIDTTDYLAGVAQAESALAEAKLALETERARARQAELEWNKLGGEAEPTGLVLRKPQMESAEARIRASEAALEKARRDLERTVIRAPYPCRVRAKHTDIGSFLVPGAPVVDLYQTGALEVRLPVALDDFAFIDPEKAPVVELSAQVAGETHRWRAGLERTEGVVDRASRSVFLVARIDPQADADDSRRYLAPGMFVRADVTGVPLKNVFSIPREAVYDNDHVLVISDDNRVAYRKITVVRTEQEHVFASDGIAEGELVSVTPLETVIEGETTVRIETLNGVKRTASDGEAKRPQGTAVPVS